MKVIITSPSLKTHENVSGISSITQFIINTNTAKEYIHFELGKKDNESRNLFWFLRILDTYLKWFCLMFIQKNALIHFNIALKIFSILRDFPLILFARVLGKPMIIHLHGGEYLTDKELPVWMTFILKCSLFGKNPKIVISNREEEALKRKLNIGNIFVLPNCIELKNASEFHRTYAIDEMLTLLFMGRISVDKGINHIFQAFEILKKKHIKFKFIMAGKGPDERVFVQKFGELLGKQYEFRGVVAGRQKSELLEMCNVFLLPSFFEGLPMALLESMSFGIVPITTNVGSIKFVINNGNNGIIVNKNSSEEIASAIEKLYTDKDYMQELSTNARKYIFSNFKPDAYIAKLNEIYNYE